MRPPTRRDRWVWLMAGALAAPSASGAQVDDPAPDAAEAEPRVGCLQGAPRPSCRSFWLVELQASTALMAPRYESSDPNIRFHPDTGGEQYEWNLGHMANLDDRWALGATVSLGSGVDDIFTGTRARLRRWLGTSASLELEVGLARSNANHNWYPDQTGLSTGLRLNILDYGSAFVRYDGFGEPELTPLPYDRGAEGSQHFLRGGVGLGGKAALAGTGVVVVAYMVLWGLFAASGGYT